MREKMKIAKSFRISRNSFSNNPKYKPIMSKCYHAYVFQCILKGKESFTLFFGSYYMQSFPKRLSNWCKYGIYKFYLVHFTPNDDKTFKKYELIHYNVSKPIHIKMAYCVDELFLSYYLKSMGFEIVNEQTYSLSTTYEIAKI